MSDAPITPQEMAKLIARFYVHFPRPEKSTGELTVLAEDFFEQFQNNSREIIQKAARLALARCKFFPKIADLAEAVAEIKAHRPRPADSGRLKITQDPTYKSEWDRRHKEVVHALSEFVAHKITKSQLNKILKLHGLPTLDDLESEKK